MNPAHGGDDGMPYAIIVFISVVHVRACLLAHILFHFFLCVHSCCSLQKDKQHNKMANPISWFTAWVFCGPSTASHPSFWVILCNIIMNEYCAAQCQYAHIDCRVLGEWDTEPWWWLLLLPSWDEQSVLCVFVRIHRFQWCMVTRTLRAHRYHKLVFQLFK